MVQRRFAPWGAWLAVLVAGCGDGGRGRGAAAPRTVGTSSTAGASAEGVAELERRVDELVLEVAMLRSELASLRSQRTSLEPAESVAAPTALPEGERSPAWYLQEYVRSFAGGGEGSEYFRLAVQAYAPELLPEIGALVLDARSVTALRMRLVAMLADARFRGSGPALGLCLRVLPLRASDEVVAQALAALARIGVSETAAAIEGTLWSIESLPNRRLAVELLVGLAGEGANSALARLWSRTLDDAERAFLISKAAPNEALGALALFDLASQAGRDVRLAAANAVDAFRFPEFPPFVAGWIEREPDEGVRVALGAAQRRLAEKKGWSAEQATGAPDAEPARDDQHAWATAEEDMGTQWLELGYDPPRRANGLRIHEVCVPGAIAAVLATDTNGRRHELWSGLDPTATPGVFELWFTPTDYAVRSVRLVLDTDRRPGWSEIDAVELIGPDGRAFASAAHASSSFAGGSPGASFVLR
jgi:hypothetical protein